MQRVIETLRTGKAQSVTALLCVAFLTLSLAFWEQKLLAALLMFVGLLLGVACYIGILSEIKMVHALIRVNARRPGGIRVNSKHVGGSQLSDAHREKLAYHSPLRLPPGENVSRPVSGVAGRLAATRETEVDSSSYYLSLFCKPSDVDKILVWTIGVPGEDLGLNLEVVEVSPGEVMMPVDPDVSFLVIYESANFEGQWYSFMDAVCTSQMLELLALIKNLKENGTLIVFEETNMATVFRSSIEKYADILIDKNGVEVDSIDDRFAYLTNKIT